jgi:hypothetical protein
MIFDGLKMAWRIDISRLHITRWYEHGFFILGNLVFFLYFKKLNFYIFFLFQINIFLIFLDHFNVLILKNKKYYFDIFLNEKHFENQNYIFK